MRRSRPRAPARAGQTLDRARGEPRRAVVGFDGSETSRAALRYAAHRAGDGGRLLVVHAVEIPVGLAEGVYIARPQDNLQRRAEDLLATIGTDDAAGAELETRVVDGPAAACLAEEAERWSADEIVVGSHGKGRLRALLGSHSHALLHTAMRPVVVFPERAARAATIGRGRFARAPRTQLGTAVVGWDGSRASRAALAFAIERVGPAGRIIAVHAYTPPADWLGRPFYDDALVSSQARGRALLDELGSLNEQLATELLEGPPAKALEAVAAANDAEEIVVGSQRTGTVRALRGSVAHDLLHEAERPVTLVPADPTENP